MNRPTARAVAILAALVVLGVICAGGIAVAYWHASGFGHGAATTDTAAAVTVAPGTPTDSLYPGGRADVIVTVSNPNATAVTIANLSLDPTQANDGFSVDAAHSACGTTSLSFDPQTNAGAGWTVPARTGGIDGSLPVELSDALAMDIGAANSCQGAQFTVYLVAGS